MQCGMGRMITTNFSEKSLSNVCPQIEDSLFPAIYILRPINVLWPPSMSTCRHSQPEEGNAKLICVIKLLSQADISELQWLCFGYSAGLHGNIICKKFISESLNVNFHCGFQYLACEVSGLGYYWETLFIMLFSRFKLGLKQHHHQAVGQI